MTNQPTDDLPDDDTMARALHDGRGLEQPPPAVLQRSMALWRPRGAAAAVQAADALLRRITAVLRIDTALQSPLALGLRSGTGTGGGQVRQLLFSADGHDIDLRLSAEPGARPTRWRIDGQLLGPVSEGRVVLLCDDWSAEAAWNPMCEFRFDAVPAGRCSLLLRGDGWEITLGPVELPAAPGAT